MRVIEKDLDHNKVKVRAQTLDDLWHLSHIIELGDIVFAKTFRRVEIERPDKLRPEAFEKRPVYLGIRVKNLEFHKYTNRLRILGTIEAGDESIGAHHTIEVEPRTVLTIEKEQCWKPDQLQRLKEAERAVRVPYVLVVTMDEGEADLAIIRQYGIDQVGKIERSIPGKQAEWKVRAEVKTNFYHEVAKAIQNAIDVEKGIKTIVIAGPGFVKNEFFDLLKEKYLEIASKTSIETVSAVGTAGVQEAIKRGIIDRVVKETRVAKETTLVERVFEEIGKNSNLATYGFEAVETAANYGAIETLLVADEFLRKARFEKAIDIDSILETARKARGAIIIVSTEHESGKKLLALGGIAALLRYPLKIEH